METWIRNFHFCQGAGFAGIHDQRRIDITRDVVHCRSKGPALRPSMSFLIILVKLYDLWEQDP